VETLAAVCPDSISVQLRTRGRTVSNKYRIYELDSFVLDRSAGEETGAVLLGTGWVLRR
jgi:hypothetical protein